MAIKNIIFDLCGPICDIDPRRIVNTLKQYKVPNIENLFVEISNKDFIKNFEAGKISAEEFRNEIRGVIQLNLSDETIDKAWNACFVRLPKKRVEFLGHLKLSYKLFVLSNSDIINYTYFKETFQEQLGFDIFQILFNGSCISCETGIRKPSSKAYLQIIENYNLHIEETVFIDDSAKNVEGARKVGIRSHQLILGEEEIRDLFDDRLSVKDDLFA